MNALSNELLDLLNDCPELLDVIQAGTVDAEGETA